MFRPEPRLEDGPVVTLSVAGAVRMRTKIRKNDVNFRFFYSSIAKDQRSRRVTTHCYNGLLKFIESHC